MWRDLRDESGVALAAVILIGAILFVLSIVVFVRSASDLTQVSGNRSHERAVHVAEAGIDDTLLRLTRDHFYNTGEAVPASFASRAAEKAWALQIASAPSKTVTAGGGGEWVRFKPFNANIIYAVGYVPTRASATKRRVIRVQYDFAPFKMEIAVLAADDLLFSGSPNVTTGEFGSAHANGDMDTNGHPSFSGYSSASGTYISGATNGLPAQSGGGKPPKQLPEISPRSMYSRIQYDMCPDGAVKAGPSYPGTDVPRNPTGTPCDGSLVGNSSFRSWSYQGLTNGAAEWRQSGNSPAFDGTYYFYRGSARISGSVGSTADPWDVSLFAEPTVQAAEPHNPCTHVGGDIVITGSPSMRAHTLASSVLMVAGRDITMGGNPGSGYGGAIVAHEQFDLSGNTTVNGVLVAQDSCQSGGSPVSGPSRMGGNPSITYGGGLEIPSDDIRVVLWDEL